MNQIHRKRFYYIVLFIIGLSIGAAFIFYALKQNMNAFFTPSELAAQHLPPDYIFHIGGLVKAGSVMRMPQTLKVDFIVTDLKKEIPVQFTGILPDLFREGTGVIALGKLSPSGIFIANQILAKHDENYMPKNVYQALREKAK